jgi:hypothetical protein
MEAEAHVQLQQASAMRDDWVRPLKVTVAILVILMVWVRVWMEMDTVTMRYTSTPDDGTGSRSRPALPSLYIL